MASENLSVNEHVGHAAMQSMETLRKAGFSEEQSKAQVKSMLCMYDGLISEINSLRNEMNSKFNAVESRLSALESRFNSLELEVSVLASRVQRSEIVTIIGFIGVIVTIVATV